MANSKRKIIVNGKEYRWKVGGTNHLVVWNIPEKTKHWEPLTRILGLSNDELERMKWKGNGVAITPADVEQIIKNYGW